MDIDAENTLPEIPETVRADLTDLLELSLAVTGADFAWIAERPEEDVAFVDRVRSGSFSLPEGWERLLGRLIGSCESLAIAEARGEGDLSGELRFKRGAPTWRFAAGVLARRGDARSTVALAIAGLDALSLSRESRAELSRVARQVASRYREADLEADCLETRRELERVKEQSGDTERIAKIGQWQLDLETGRLSWSDEVYRIFGVGRQAFGETFESFLSFVHPEDRTEFLEAQNRGMRGEALLAHEHRIVRREGSIRYVVEHGELLDANEAQGKRFAGVVMDITRRKEAELALQREEARYRAFFDHSPDLVFVHRNNRIEHMNRAGINLLGVERIEQVVGRSPMEFVHPDDHGLVAERLSVLVGEAPARAPHQVIRALLPNGEVVHLETCASSFISPDGGVSVQVICRDVTSRVDLERKVEENARMMGIASRLARMGAWRVELDKGRVVWSDEVAKIHGREPGYAPSLDEAIGYYVPEDRDRIAEAVARCAEEGKGFDEELSIVDAAGKRVRVRAIGLPLFGEAGRVKSVQGAFQDISEQKQVEEELQQRDRELKRAVERLTTTLESITDAFHTLDHDWRFTYVNGEAERLLDSQRSELLGRSCWDVFAAAKGTIFETEYRRAASEQVSVSFEAYYPPLESWFEVNAYPSAEGLAVYFRDVTERRKSQERMRFLETCVDRMNDIVLVTEAQPIDEPGPRITFVNEAFERLTGYTSEAALGKTPRILQGPLTDRAELDRIREALERFEPVRSTIVNYAKDGRPYWLEIDIVPMADDAGEVTHFLAVERDVTEQRRREEELREREKELTAVMNGLPGLVYLCSPEGRLIRWNREIERVLGYSGEALEHIHVLDLIASRDRERAGGRFRQVFQEGFAEDTLFLRSNVGVEIPFFLRASRVSGEDDARLLGVAVDVSERRRAETRIRKQAALLDQTQDAIFTLSDEGRVTYWNKAAETLYGWSAHEALGELRVEDLFENGETAKKGVRVTREEGFWSRETDQRDRNGKVLKMDARWTLLPENGEENQSILAVNTDISEKKQLEGQFMRGQRMEAIGTLAGGIAHDLNNILSPILLSIELLKSRISEPQLRRTLSTIENASKRGSEIVKQVLSFARGGGGGRVAAVPKHIVDEVTSLVRETFPRSIELELHVDRDVGLISVNVTQLHQALMNLCVNARDAMPEGGTLAVSVEKASIARDRIAGELEAKAGSYVKVTVSDTGSGMTDEVKEQLFDPFFSTKGEGEGTGLGLPLVYSIIKAHDGFLEVESKIGEGSSFSLWFPALSNACEEAGEREAKPLPKGSGETILLVDDEESVRAIAEETLGDFGYNVLLAENGAEALRLYKENKERIRVLITDMMMPEMDGEVLRRCVRQIDSNLPIIVTSGFSAETSKAREAENEGALLVAKPYTAETILCSIRSLLDG